jgi:hypothetical protein
LTIDSIGSNNPAFPSLTEPFVLAANEQRTIHYAITLPDTLTYTGQLTVFGDSAQPSLSLTAHGIWTELRANLSGIHLGDVAVSDTVDTVATLISVGNTSLIIQSVMFTNDHFTVLQAPADTLSAYGSTPIGLRYIRQTADDVADTLVIEYNAGAPLRIPLSVGSSSVETVVPSIPHEYFLGQNYPNPFNPSTTIVFGLPKASRTSLSVFDLLGRNVTTLEDGYIEAGTYRVMFDGRRLTSGIYFVRLAAGRFSQTRKLMLLK